MSGPVGWHAIAQRPSGPRNRQRATGLPPSSPKHTLPTVFPDRVILTVTADPAHTMAVTWRTDTSVTKAVAQIAKADHGPQFEAGAKSVAAMHNAARHEGRASPSEHSVVFEGLTPATKYLYRVGDGTHWSEWATFQTASDRARAVSVPLPGRCPE